MNHSTPVNPGSTIYDVAAQSGVSISTVSRFLNNPEKVNAETAKTIQATMDRLAYIPHGNAGTKARRQIGRIGVLAPFFPAPSFTQRLQGMTPVFRRAHCEVVIYSVDSHEQLKDYLHSIPLSKRLDGLVIMAMRIDDADVRRLERAGMQVVLIEQHHPHFCGVASDNVLAGSLAGEHFLERGYETFGFVGQEGPLPYSLQPSELRFQGYQAALTRAGRAVPECFVRLGKATVDGGFEMGLALLGSASRPRAVFAMCDLQAIGLMRAARTLGLSVPGDVAILGFDDIEAAEWVDLSTISQALEESGRLAAELLVGRIREPHRPIQNIQVKVSVVQRSTT